MRRKLIFFGVLVLALITVRFLDYTMMWYLMNLDFKDEILSNEDYLSEDCEDEQDEAIEEKDILFIDLGLSTRGKARQVLFKYVKESEKPVVLASYYNLVNPLIFLIYNKGENRKLFNTFLGILKRELTEVYIFKNETAEIIDKNGKRISTVAVLGEHSNYIFKDPNSDGLKVWLSYISLERGCSKLVFAIYFYIPLLVIIILSLFKNRSIFLAMIYFGEMCLLFGYKGFFKKAHFFYYLLSKNPGFHLFIQILFIAVISLSFLYGVQYLVNNFKSTKVTFSVILIIIFFLLLPLVLRF